MIFFGHLGLTLAAVRTADRVVIKRNFTASSKGIDYRFVLLGSLLPDIIDKSILFVISNETFRSGRVFAHSFLFALLFLALGITVQYGYKRSWVLVLAVCSFVHQILDTMWGQPNVFLWPVYGFVHQTNNKSVQAWVLAASKLPKGGEMELTWNTARKLLLNPHIGIPEVLGALIILYFAITLLRQKQVLCFLKMGTWKYK